jgi:ring-1,2-phenylacetyl-CoA epoxidase subunit PaaC
VEYPIGDYAFSLVRHYLFEVADAIRLAHLSRSSYQPLAELTTKLAREEKYHQLHARTFMQQLGQSTEEANLKLQAALNEVYPIAFGIFEPTVHSESLAQEGVQAMEDQLLKEWRSTVEPFLQSCNLKVPDATDFVEHFGGRSGHHTEHLAPLLKEMSEVFAIDPAANW